MCETGVVTAIATCFLPGLAQLGTISVVVATLTFSTVATVLGWRLTFTPRSLGGEVELRLSASFEGPLARRVSRNMNTLHERM